MSAALTTLPLVEHAVGGDLVEIAVVVVVVAGHTLRVARGAYLSCATYRGRGAARRARDGARRRIAGRARSLRRTMTEK